MTKRTFAMVVWALVALLTASASVLILTHDPVVAGEGEGQGDSGGGGSGDDDGKPSLDSSTGY
jgi:hypothetical protein